MAGRKPELTAKARAEFDSCGNKIVKSPGEPPRTLKQTMMEVEFNHFNFNHDLGA